MRKIKNFLLLIKNRLVQDGINKQNAILLVILALLLPISCLISDFFSSNLLVDLNFFFVLIPCAAVAYYNQKFFLDKSKSFTKFILSGFSINLVVALVVWGCF